MQLSDINVDPLEILKAIQFFLCKIKEKWRNSANTIRYYVILRYSQLTSDMIEYFIEIFEKIYLIY